MTTFDLSGANYSESDSANSNAAPAGMPEGMAPSGVNDAWRSGMGAVKRAYDWDHAGTWATVGGAANAIVLTYSVAPNAYVQGQKHAFKATANNTGATTLNVNSLGAKNVFKKTASGVAACAGGEIQIGDLVELEYDGTQFQIMSQAANAGFAETFGTIASAATVNIGAATANYLQVTGTTTITAFDTITAGTKRKLEFAGALTLTHNAVSLILPQGASVATLAGDVWEFTSEGSGNWRATQWPVRYATKAMMQTGTDTAAVVSPARINDADGVAKAWVVFDGTAASPITPSASFNISGTITKNASGDYTISFATAFASANYVMAGSTRVMAGSGDPSCLTSNVTAPTASAIRVLCNGGVDSSRVSLVFYGRQ